MQIFDVLILKQMTEMDRKAQVKNRCIMWFDPVLSCTGVCIHLMMIYIDWQAMSMPNKLKFDLITIWLHKPYKCNRKIAGCTAVIPVVNRSTSATFCLTSFSATPLDCEVSLWSSWGLCLGPCSRGGVRHRTRYILLRPANAGTPCPELEEQSECVPHSCMRLQ